MRILITANPAVGHLLPLLPLGIAARDAGHDVAIGTGASLAPMIDRAGLRAVEIGLPDMESVRATIPDFESYAGRRRAVVMWTMGFAGPLAGRIASDVLRVSEDWRPDILIHEDTELGSWIAAECLGIPQGDLQVTAWRPGMHRVVAEPLGRLREAHGLAPDLALEGLFGDIFLSTRPPLLQAPEFPLPAHAVPMRPIVLDDVVDTDDPAWLHDRRSGRPRVGVTLGTANAGRIDLIRSILEGLAGSGCEVVVTVGEDGDPEVLADAGPNVRVVRYLAMSRLLPTCDALVFHGGSGTMLAALSVGLPLVIVPISADQPDNAERCQAAGVARVVPEAALTAEAVREAVADVLGEARFRSQARAVAAQIAAMPAPADILPKLEALVTEGSV